MLHVIAQHSTVMQDTALHFLPCWLARSSEFYHAHDLKIAITDSELQNKPLLYSPFTAAMSTNNHTACLLSCSLQRLCKCLPSHGHKHTPRPIHSHKSSLSGRVARQTPLYACMPTPQAPPCSALSLRRTT